MIHHRSRIMIVGLTLLVCLSSWAVQPTRDEMSDAHRWATAALDDPRDGTPLPFSFSYGGKPSRQVLGSWRFASSSARLDGNRTRRTATATDPATGLMVRCEAIEYSDFPIVEWTVYFANAGLQDTPILTDIKAVDIHLKHGPGTEFVLHHNHHAGSRVDYQPFVTPLGPGADKRLFSSGKSSVQDWPYFNLEWGGEGLIAVLGWPGSWVANFTRDQENGLRIAGGQEIATYKLRPGEETRTPLVVLQFWRGDHARSQNLWRRWMLAHGLPKAGDGPLAPILAAGNTHLYNYWDTDEPNQKLFIDRYVAERIRPDYWWIDMGWFAINGAPGTWEVNTQHYPNGLKPVSDYAHQHEMKFLVWFHPEVVTLPGGAGTWLHQQRRWLLGPQYRDQYILNFGNPRTWGWIVNQVDRLIDREGIDLYRHDFNTDFYTACIKNDPADRKGITEVRYCQGFLAFYDELRRRHPGMLVDNCSSGYGRNDLETLRRSLPLWRSDDYEDPTRQQGITEGIAPWVPFHGTGIFVADGADLAYVFWSKMSASLLLGWDLRRKELDYDLLRKLVRQWRALAPYYLGDFYPLTAFSAEKNQWAAFQYDRPEAGDGLVQVFRRDECAGQTLRVKLMALEARSHYEVTGLDDRISRPLSGRELREMGLSVTATNRPAAVVMTYRKVKE